MWNKIKSLYGLYERPISSVSLVGGFIFDIVTLERIDKVWDNLWVLAHIVIVAIFMVLVQRTEIEEGDEANPSKKHFWYVNILQFFFGGLLSVFLVFYFRSSDLTVSWPFLLILAIAFWANESMKRNYIRLTFQTSLFFLSLFACAIFLFPVVSHQIGPKIFIISGLSSLLLMLTFLFFIARVAKEKFKQSKRSILVSIATIFLSMNILYFTNLIPPIPISLKDSGIYHLIYKNSDGDYVAETDKFNKPKLFEFYDTIYIQKGDPVYVYSAIFLPSMLDLNIVHQWQYYDTTLEKWVNSTRVTLPLVGGRDGGFRTYSMKANLSYGDWRVKIETVRGQVVGTVRFKIIQTTENVPLSTKSLE